MGKVAYVILLSASLVHPVYCPGQMIECGKEKCLPETLMCNGVEDCPDGRDEPGSCGKLCLSP